ncbi:hypothetical protein [Sporomusa termitida]|uniref:Uncharacterized protein n=1 Tax=Sporomusa termitida TaxID=2377 RepID=A0A517DXK4_9FIRM|nr:hypothetical protein [Sporomusa termitida]QDR82081.1 hypothetical protein SPTER_35020 [Sporomusa termitida]
MRVIIAKCLRPLLYPGLVVLLLTLSTGTGLAAPNTVDKITVTISAAEPPPARVAKRMTASVTTVGTQMLAGRPVSEVEASQGSYENLVREIFDRVLVGYTVGQVRITPGTTTHIRVEVVPWGDVVRDVTLEVDFGGLSPAVKSLIQTDLSRVEDQIANVLTGLPVDSIEWAGGVSTAVIRELLADQLPEFRSNLEIAGGRTTHIKLSLIPIGPVIDNVHVAMRSRSIPNVLLAKASPAVSGAAGMLRGLPVAFVERHQDYFTERITAAAAGHPITSQYGLQLTPVVEPGRNTEIILNAETSKYRVTLEGSLDMGREENNTAGKLHFGKFTGSRDEVFLEVEFLPDNLTWEFEPGWGHKFTDNTMAGFRYNFSEQESTLWVNHYMGANWTLRFEHTPRPEYNEFGVRYKLHDFLSTEYVITNKESWLRLVANL